ncbi:helix-turn-helix domain-containing protein [Actinoplanes sp. NPDC023936]|uniref:helix-turn-helix domain-containing protein n=1 Tax=Actinoplanes sp. NPDC023936 TaxID=3154910 RepID=UPI0034097806
MSEAYPTTEERIVAEFGDGHDVQGIALRYGRTVEQIYAVVERELSQDPPTPQPPPGQDPLTPQPPLGQDPLTPQPPWPSYPPGPYTAPPSPYSAPPSQYAAQPGHYAPQPPGQYLPPAYPVQGFPPAPGFPDEDAVVAEYSEGHDVEAIARKHGIAVDRIYEIVQRAVSADPQYQPADPTVWKPPA